MTRCPRARTISPGRNGAREEAVDDDTLVILYERPEERVGGFGYMSVMFEDDECSLAAPYPSVVGEGWAVSAAVSKADAGVVVDVGMIVLLTLNW